MARRVQRSTAGLRHYYALPFARELTEDDQDTLERALRETTLSTNTRTHSPTFPTVDVSHTHAYVEFDLGPGADFTPADVGAALYAAAGEWHAEHGPLATPTRLGGRQELGTLASPALGCASGRAGVDDRVGDILEGADPESAPRYYQLLFPTRQLADEEVSITQHVIGDRGTATETYVALVDAPQPTAPPHLGGYGVSALREDLTAQLPARRESDLLDRFFFDRRELGSLPTHGVRESDIRTAVQSRGAERSPLGDTDTQTPEPQPEGV